MTVPMDWGERKAVATRLTIDAAPVGSGPGLAARRRDSRRVLTCSVDEAEDADPRRAPLVLDSAS